MTNEINYYKKYTKYKIKYLDNIQKIVHEQFGGSDTIKQIACGSYHSIILKIDGTIYVTGYNAFGQLGLGDTQNRDSFIKVSKLDNVKQVACGANYTFILKKDGTIYATGGNGYGQLGLGDELNRDQFEKIDNMYNVKQITCRLMHTLIIQENGTLYATGNNDSGQLGLGHTENRKKFEKVNNMNDITQIACGNYHSLILKNDKTIYATGRNGYGQLGLGDERNRNQFEKIDHMYNVKQITCGPKHTFIIQENGTLYATGNNELGQLGLPVTYSNLKLFTKVLSFVKQIATNDDNTIILKENGTIHGLGNNEFRELGIEDSINIIDFTEIKYQINNINQIVLGAYYTLILSDFTKLYAVGDNVYGQLGVTDKNLTKLTQITLNFDQSVPHTTSEPHVPYVHHTPPEPHVPPEPYVSSELPPNLDNYREIINKFVNEKMIIDIDKPYTMKDLQERQNVYSENKTINDIPNKNLKIAYKGENIVWNESTYCKKNVHKVLRWTRLMTFNVHNFRKICGNDTDKFDYNHALTYVTHLQPDILSMQEIVPDYNYNVPISTNSTFKPITDTLNNIGLNKYIIGDTTHVNNKLSPHFSQSYYLIANGLFTKFTIIDKQIYELGANRTMVYTHINIGTDEILIFNIHLLFSLTNTHSDLLLIKNQIDNTVDIIEALKHITKINQIILCGDFNNDIYDSAKSDTFDKLKQSLNDVIPSNNINTGFNQHNKIDKIFVSNEFASKYDIYCTVVEIDASDHYPLIMDFREKSIIKHIDKSDYQPST
jgi:alpha-tubulin suppressor-like RCC1 family protein/endonuclease/exonuclease/phosphatase family metal-dependent hydrolase